MRHLCRRTQFDIIRFKEINEHSNPRLAVLDKLKRTLQATRYLDSCETGNLRN